MKYNKMYVQFLNFIWILHWPIKMCFLILIKNYTFGSNNSEVIWQYKMRRKWPNPLFTRVDLSWAKPKWHFTEAWARTGTADQFVVLSFHSKRQCRLTSTKAFWIETLGNEANINPIFRTEKRNLSKSKNVEAISRASFIFQVLTQYYTLTNCLCKTPYAFHNVNTFFFCSFGNFSEFKLNVCINYYCEINRHQLLEVVSSTKVEVAGFSTATNNYSAKGIFIC